jgi:acetyl esterase/lipase
MPSLRPLPRKLQWLALPLLASIAGSLFAWAHSSTSGDYRIVHNLTYTPPGWPQALAGDLYLPTRTGPIPVLLVVHGGSWKSGDRDGWDVAPIARHLAAHGYAAFSVDYRLAPTWLYPAPLDDLQLAVSWLRAHAGEYHLDADAVGAWGYSAGAHLVSMLGTKDNAQLHLRAVVAGGTPADLTRWPDSPVVKEFLGKNARENLALSAAASPINHIDANTPPFFLYHGAWDTLVEPEQAKLMADALRAQGVSEELYYLSGFGHILTAIIPGEALDKGTAFLDAHLMPATPLSTTSTTSTAASVAPDSALTHAVSN